MIAFSKLFKEAAYLTLAGSLFKSAAAAAAKEQALSVGSIFCIGVAAEYCCLSGDRKQI